MQAFGTLEVTAVARAGSSLSVPSSVERKRLTIIKIKLIIISNFDKIISFFIYIEIFNKNHTLLS